MTEQMHPQHSYDEDHPYPIAREPFHFNFLSVRVATRLISAFLQHLRSTRKRVIQVDGDRGAGAGQAGLDPSRAGKLCAAEDRALEPPPMGQRSFAKLNFGLGPDASRCAARYAWIVPTSRQ